MSVSIASFLDHAKADMDAARLATQNGDAAKTFEQMANAIACLGECIKLLDTRTAAVESEHPAPPPPPLG
ncbi:MAG: hypothetical protein H0W40_13210 [Methylibium sp.]|uniref:hypothetical protein n=1 Tax=Methylibium sp. TaxID=2067992 RepID=UPI00178DC55A|nr:hypothetical protein [Methylibium sp.]MBA3598314.1 hypothetical protein [Methylibium sp.]